jgi:hypothetical protein
VCVCVCVFFFGRREVQNSVRVQLGLHLKYMGAGKCRIRRTFLPVVALGRKNWKVSLLLDTGEKCLASQHARRWASRRRRATWWNSRNSRTLKIAVARDHNPPRKRNHHQSTTTTTTTTTTWHCEYQGDWGGPQTHINFNVKDTQRRKNKKTNSDSLSLVKQNQNKQQFILRKTRKERFTQRLMNCFIFVVFFCIHAGVCHSPPHDWRWPASQRRSIE